MGDFQVKVQPKSYDVVIVGSGAGGGRQGARRTGAAGAGAPLCCQHRLCRGLCAVARRAAPDVAADRRYRWRPGCAPDC